MPISGPMRLRLLLAAILATCLLAPSAANARSCGSYQKYGSYRFDNIRTVNVSCRRAKRVISYWLGHQFHEPGYWYCTLNWGCSAGNGRYAPHFTYRYRWIGGE